MHYIRIVYCAILIKDLENKRENFLKKNTYKNQVHFFKNLHHFPFLLNMKNRSTATARYPSMQLSLKLAQINCMVMYQQLSSMHKFAQ